MTGLMEYHVYTCYTKTKIFRLYESCLCKKGRLYDTKELHMQMTKLAEFNIF